MIRIGYRGPTCRKNTPEVTVWREYFLFMPSCRGRWEGLDSRRRKNKTGRVFGRPGCRKVWEVLDGEAPSWDICKGGSTGPICFCLPPFPCRRAHNLGGPKSPRQSAHRCEIHAGTWPLRWCKSVVNPLCSDLQVIGKTLSGPPPPSTRAEASSSFCAWPSY